MKKTEQFFNKFFIYLQKRELNKKIISVKKTVSTELLVS